MKILKIMAEGRLRWGVLMSFLAVLMCVIRPLPAYPVVMNSGNSETQPKVTTNGFEYVPGEILVKLKKEVSAAERKKLLEESETEAVSEIRELKVQKIKSKKGASTEQLLQRYRNDPRVEYAEPNGIFRALATPNDPRFSDLWGLHNTGQLIFFRNGTSFNGTAGADIDAPEAWDAQTGSPEIIVADIDTGVYYSHPDLAANIWINPWEIPGNFHDDDGNGYVDDVYGWDFANNDNDPLDDHGHGTHTSGTIAAVGNNGIGVTGVNWRARVMAVKFLSAMGEGTWEDAAEAILYASMMGARVSNNSWGCGPNPDCFSQVVDDALQVASQRGMLFVVAAGNADNDNDAIAFYPCTSNQPNVVCVAATDFYDQKARFSNYGISTVDLGAPGVNTLSTVLPWDVPCSLGGLCDASGYAFANGTSMATPHVAGAAALLLAEPSHRDITVDETRDALMAAVDPLPALAGITATGGRLNLQKVAQTRISTNFTIQGSPENQVILGGESTTFTVTVTSKNGYSVPVTLSFASSDPSVTGNFSPSVVTPPANGSVVSTLSVSTTSATRRGSYVLIITGRDSLGEVRIGKLTLIVPGPDFELGVLENVSNVFPYPDRYVVASGGSTTLTVTVKSYEGFSAPVTLSLETSDPNLQGSFSPNPVTPPANGETTVPLTVSASSAAIPGIYTLRITGSDGYKSHTVQIFLLVSNVDLTMISFSGPNSGVTGGKTTLSDTVTNKGTETSGAFYLSYYLSTDNVITSSDTGIGWRYVVSLDPGARNRLNTDISLPNIAPGVYYLGVIADSLDMVFEYNERNNVIAGGTITVSAGADLVVTAVGGPSTAQRGGKITVTDTVKNQGTGQTLSSGDFGQFGVGFYLSPDATVTTSDIFLGSRIQTPLLNGGSAGGSTTLVIPDVAAGTYYIGAVVDYLGTVPEGNETNNGRAGNSLVVSVVNVDLVIAAVSGPTTSGPGSVITLTDSVKNQGGVSAGIFSVGFYLSDDATITSGDTFLGSRSVSGLAPGATSSGTTPVTIPDSVAVGTYYIGAIADSANDVPETIEANNTLSGNSISLTLADLFLTGVSGPITAAPGSVFAITATVRNQGAGSVNRWFDVGYYLSFDNVIANSDIYLGSRTVPNLVSGAENTGSDIAIVPATVPPGLYYLGAIVDYPNYIPETDDRNNGLSGNTVDIQTGSDLVMISVSGPTASGPGASVPISYTVKNQGTGAAGEFNVGVYLSSDSIIDTSDTWFGSTIVSGNLLSGASITRTDTFTLPSNIPSGIYYLGAIADPYSQVSETNEVNNTLSGNTLAITLGDLVMTTVSGPTKAAKGSSIMISDTVRNQGTAAVGAFYVGLYLSIDAIITTSDTFVGYRYVGALESGANSSGTTTVTMSTTGQYYIGAIADYQNWISESNESNNARAGNSIRITNK